MFKWLRSWFAWRFSLRRLVIATLFLGAVVGLNMQKIGPIIHPYEPQIPLLTYFWGWPLPCANDWQNVPGEIQDEAGICRAPEVGTVDFEIYLEKFREHCIVAEHYQFPAFHQTYRLLIWVGGDWLFTYYGVKVGAGVNVLIAFTTFALILFLKIPRRRDPSPLSARAGG
jgi:hypothetical protein